MWKISEWIKLKWRMVEIPDASRFDLADFFKEMWYKIWVEIWTQNWIFAESLCQSWAKLYCVDPWKNYDDYWGEWTFTDITDKQYESVKEMLSKYGWEAIRKTSMEAVKDFENESLDFVYIDWNHELKYVIEDIHEWLKKLKKGGCICGHDYFYAQKRKCDNIHVKQAVDLYTQLYDINDYYIIWRKETREWEKRDNFRSFMWIK